MDLQTLLDEHGFDDWEGDWDMLTCPCGYSIEHDGRCPNGCVSPLIQLGII